MNIRRWKLVRRYLDDLKSLWNLIIASLWGVILVYAFGYADLVFHWIGLFFTWIGNAVVFLAYLPRNTVGWFTSLVGFTGMPENVLTLVFVIGFSILVMPIMKMIFQLGDKVQDWLYERIRWKN